MGMLKKALSFVGALSMLVIFCGAMLHACAEEQKADDLKYAQWKYERENGLPYSSFKGE